MKLKEMIERYDAGADWIVLKETNYNRQKLSRFKEQTGAQYTTMNVEGDLFVLFNERHAAVLINE